ncbi:MAG TPA: PEPxxWA-CTERM sorting domain-containing protein [Phenylobacterium sp.]|nr:PEPxxWA-CTERM sorting domain-containing protein [Phenylobacterium sp.]
MKNLRTALIAVSALAALAASPAAAAPTAPKLTSQVANTPLPAGLFMIDTFDAPIAPGFAFYGGLVRLGSLGAIKSVTAPPPGDLTKYLTVLGGKTATLTSVTPLKKLSLYMGSPDSFNAIRFIGTGYDFTLMGSQLWQPLAATDGDWGWGRRLIYDFGSYGVTKVVFSSTRNSLEFDDLAGAIQTAVPEPSSWALMLLGFFGAGALIRRRTQAPRLA